MPPPAQMRLRITRQLRESIDGIQFSAFRPGYVYEVGTTTGNYLLASGAAEPAEDDEPYLILPPEKHLFYPTPTRRVAPGGVPERPPVAIAADRQPRRRAQRNARVSARIRPRVASRLRARVAALAKKVDRIKDELERLRRAS